MNAYWKHNLKYIRSSHLPKSIINPSQDTSQLTSGAFDNLENRKSGRSWKTVELRLKSDEDLHKLWYVLLKEKLGLKSDHYYNNQNNYMITDSLRNNATKIDVSMGRLKTVVDERNRIRNELMSFLEFYYIRKMQTKEGVGMKATTKQEEASDVKELVPVKRKRTKSIRGEIEHDTTTKAKVEKKEEKELKEKLSTVDRDKPKEHIKVSVLDQKEIKIVKNLKKKFVNKNHLLNEYVKNHQFLDAQERRKVHAKIQSVRSSQAKEIFMKEMAAISYKLKNVNQSADANKSKLENLF